MPPGRLIQVSTLDTYQSIKSRFSITEAIRYHSLAGKGNFRQLEGISNLGLSFFF